MVKSYMLGVLRNSLLKPIDTFFMMEVSQLQVLTVTLNPALDRELIVENFSINKLHRVKNPRYSAMEPGGKGINVSIILSGLNISSIAVGFLGGFIGSVVEEKLRNSSDLVTTSFVHVNEETRENIAVVDPVNDTITEINSAGPTISENDFRMFIRRYETLLSRVKIVVFSGSLPPGLPDDVSHLLGSKAIEAGRLSISEAYGKSFEKSIESGSLTVAKPDLRNGKNLFGNSLVSLDDYIHAAKHIISSGTKLAILSYEIEGDVIATEEGVWLFKSKKHIEHSHLLGTGDSFIAGVTESLLRKQDYMAAAQRGMAAAIAETKFLSKERFTLEDVDGFADSFDVKRLG